MSFIGNAKRVDSYCEVEDGTYQVKIVEMKVASINKKNALVVMMRINAPSWNKIPFRYVIYEGDSFDLIYSRFCDAFGADVETSQNEIMANDFHQFTQIGMATFNHLQRKLVQTGINPNGTPIQERKTEQSDFVQLAKFIPFQKHQITPEQPPIPPQVQNIAELLGGGTITRHEGDDFSDLPF